MERPSLRTLRSSVRFVYLIDAEGDNMLAKRKSEKFFRIKCSQLKQLLSAGEQTESIYSLGGADEEEEKESAPGKAESVNSVNTQQTSSSQVTYDPATLHGITVTAALLLIPPYLE